jgi:hypothetical protein
VIGFGILASIAGLVWIADSYAAWPAGQRRNDYLKVGYGILVSGAITLAIAIIAYQLTYPAH